MQTVRFDFSEGVPIISTTVHGPQKARRVRFIFDTGSVRTQIDSGFLKAIGYPASKTSRLNYTQGQAGEISSAYLLTIPQFSVFGRSFSDLKVAAFDFQKFSYPGIDGLLGFDIIQQFHFELNGPRNWAVVY